MARDSLLGCMALTFHWSGICNASQNTEAAMAASIYLLVRKPRGQSMFAWLAADILTMVALVVHILHLRALG
eukprot:9004639-Pyramimonas_sp.AAC.1